MDTFEAVAARVERWWPAIDHAAQQYGVSQALLEAVIHEESGGDPEAFPEHPERAGASFGLMQLLLPTARAVGFNLTAPRLFDPALNIFLGAKYLSGLRADYHDWRLALIAYNGGPWAVRRARVHLPPGPAGHYANVVLALSAKYAVRNLARLKAAGPAGAAPTHPH